ncbi:hypothetical protein DAEQUDRAFT_798008 [Daedalea quercina L-15889]|uniref:Glucose-methanol-choline oxidoreductase C-terminal domain-containing protein n=1 Tax=Daedalea quercina L-15889 TaxID=1314783 RepID=A0A165MZJ3_9APHY|nr:hypothetical protein DAEQUDRAFT_798008 [Daedalea quercina L-15889]
MPSRADEDTSLSANNPDIEVIPPDRMAGHISCSFLCTPVRPTSTGTVRLASSDPLGEPLIDLNYFSTEYDMDMFLRDILSTRRPKDETLGRSWSVSFSESDFLK